MAKYFCQWNTPKCVLSWSALNILQLRMSTFYSCLQDHGISGHVPVFSGDRPAVSFLRVTEYKLTGVISHDPTTPSTEHDMYDITYLVGIIRSASMIINFVNFNNYGPAIHSLLRPNTTRDLVEARFQGLDAITTKFPALWHVTPCFLTDIQRCVRPTVSSFSEE